MFHHNIDIAPCHKLMKSHLVKHNTHIFAKPGAVCVYGFSEHSDFSAVAFYNIQYQIDSRGLTGAVLSDKSAYSSLRYGKGHIL